MTIQGIMFMGERPESLIDRTLRTFRRAWRGAGIRGGTLKDGLDPALPEPDAVRLRAQIAACLEGRGGEVSARNRAAELGEAYLVLDPTGRRRFLEILARDYDVDDGAVNDAIAALEAAADPGDRRRARAGLREALVPPRVRLLTHFNQLRLGVKFVVDLRADLIGFAAGDDALSALDRELRELMGSWFDVGVLELERMTWQTPASLLEKLIEYEAVHAIRSWDDLKNRLESDRRCYAFFHPHMPDEPLIFVEVALVTGISDNIQRLLDERAPAEDPLAADTAIFYSISNCQDGLAGVGFGNFLIKRVAADLARDLPNVKVFATLSPLDGFIRWLAESPRPEEGPGPDPDQRRKLADALGPGEIAAGLERLARRADWFEDAALAGALEPVLLKLAAQYLVEARRDGRARDRVAHFHLTNGARIERIDWLADTSPRGLRRSLGIMVNYRYLLADVEDNHEAYTGHGTVATAAPVRKLLRG